MDEQILVPLKGHDRIQEFIPEPDKGSSNRPHDFRYSGVSSMIRSPLFLLAATPRLAEDSDVNSGPYFSQRSFLRAGTAVANKSTEL
jgi:hypothetical protein